jgi:YggT family protein
MNTLRRNLMNRLADKRAKMARDERGFVVATIINLVFGIILTLLALRFVLRLLGANPENAFASFVYGLSQPLVAPFFGLFRNQGELTTANFDVATLIALIVYALIAGLLSRVLFVDRRRV